MALTYTPTPTLKNPCPEFNLKGMDQKWYGRKDFLNTQGLLVMFICNHCPYVKAIEDRLIQLAADLQSLQISTVGICSNDSVSYPDDSFESLQKRWREKNYKFPYLHDEDQSVAQEFGAVCTPDFFLYDKSLKLFYRGRLDDSWKEPSQVKHRELFEAAKKMREGRDEVSPQTPSMGCSIKWIKK